MISHHPPSFNHGRKEFTLPTYRVDRPDQKPRIVDAPNPAAARQHVAKSDISVSMITASDAFKLAQDGAVLETAGEQLMASGEEPKPPLSLGQAGAGQDSTEDGEPKSEDESN
jgi:hypothetical protein